MKLVQDQHVIVIPEDATLLKHAIISELHQSGLGGHLGKVKLEKLLRTRFYWKNMSSDVD